MTEIRKIGVLTSGGDAPGMNAAIRSVVRRAMEAGLQMVGIYGGYRGLIQNDVKELNSRSVGNIIQRGGTILKTARSDEFRKDEGLVLAKQTLEYNRIQGLVLIGGDGTYRGGVELSKVWDGAVIGVPGTIDNDLYGTDETIGYDTAVNTALDAIDRVRDTADAHERFFLIEVMGRHAGFIALDVAISGGAEEVLLPEVEEDLDKIGRHLHEAHKMGKTSSIIIVAEGEQHGNATEIAEKLRKISDCDYRVVVLGHIQRGGSPTARDRVLAAKLGAFAVESLLEGKKNVAVGELKGERSTIPLEEAITKKKPLDSYLRHLLPILSR